VTELGGALDARNTAAEPQRIKPQTWHWRPQAAKDGLRYSFSPQSFTVMHFEAK